MKKKKLIYHWTVLGDCQTNEFGSTLDSINLMSVQRDELNRKRGQLAVESFQLAGSRPIDGRSFDRSNPVFKMLVRTCQVGSC